MDLIKNLLDHIENYEQKFGNSDLKAFSIYLRDEVSSEKKLIPNEEFDKNNYQNYKSYAEVEFSTLLTNLYRFAKHYMKKAFAGSEIKTIDEFGFLASLLKQKSLMKNELINQHLLETSSGSEILKRLIKNGLVKEIPDTIDKRAKRVSLTAKGVETVMGSFDEMHIISEIIVGNLKDDELKQALQVFNKLTYFHQHIHDCDRNSDLEEIHSKYIS
ncbi:MAG: MarR family winged helix-turn-helix transcriptional regulator [Bacteroidales bacterium]|nr:MarR family winged helix-turn-helix transcriptional regulator [Bacteroidales bacterium]